MYKTLRFLLYTYMCVRPCAPLKVPTITIYNIYVYDPCYHHPHSVYINILFINMLFDEPELNKANSLFYSVLFCTILLLN